MTAVTATGQVWTETPAGPVWTPLYGDLPDSPVVADSWLVRDGMMRAPERHARRFAAACAESLGVPLERSEGFFRAALALIPASGAWFPRIELMAAPDSPRLQLWIRPAPPLGRSVRLWVDPAPDRRSRPGTKGPDLGFLGGLRRVAVEQGADEALILSAGGAVLEGATTSLLWWRGETLCRPCDALPVLPGVTRDLLLALAAAEGVPTREEVCCPEELAGLETWAVNALHGIRPVTGWVGVDVGGLRPGPAPRLAAWRRRLERQSVPVGPHAAAGAR